MKTKCNGTKQGVQIGSKRLLKTIIDVFGLSDYQELDVGDKLGDSALSEKKTIDSFESLWTDSELQYIFSVIDRFNIFGFKTLMLFQRNSRVGQIICRTFDPDLLTQWVLELFSDFPEVKLSVLKTIEELDEEAVYH